MNNVPATGKETIKVLNPCGTPLPITLVPMAPRLESLEGKTIYIVDVNFPLTEVFYEAIQKVLTQEYPDVKWIVKKKKGNTFEDDQELWREIRENGHGVIVGPGHMDTLGPAVVGWCITLEKLGIPAVPIIGADFPEIVKTVAYEKGMPEMRLTFIPHFTAQIPADACMRYLKGNDPINNRPVIHEIVEGLTRQPTAEESKTGIIERSVPVFIDPDTPGNLRSLFLEKGWTDGLPIILPTEEKVDEMLRGTSHEPDEIVGRMSPASTYDPWEYSVRQVAVNAVMAGARAEHFPVILAISSTETTSLWSSCTSQARMVVVNGPIRNEINMNSGIGALGPFNEANAVIGRAWTLISKNLGKSGIPEVTYLGTIGNNLNYNNLCYAENEEALPMGWRPLHVQKGHKREESVITLLGGWTIVTNGCIKPYPLNEIISRQLLCFETSGTGGFFYPRFNLGSHATVLLAPQAAIELADQGFDTKEKLSDWLKENTFMTMWNYWVAEPDNLKAAKEGIEPFASMLKLPPEASSPQPLINPNDPVEIIMVGGEAVPMQQSGDFRFWCTASIDKWR